MNRPSITIAIVEYVAAGKLLDDIAPRDNHAKKCKTDLAKQDLKDHI